MPNYKVPAEKSFGIEGKDEKRQPSVSIPMKPEWLTKIKMGETIDVLVRGKVEGLDSHESKSHSDSTVRVGVTEVEYYKTKKNMGDKMMEFSEDDTED